jgi:hypothetical protein
MILVSYAVNIRLGVTTDLHILRLVLCHYAIESEEQIQICWFSTFGRAPVVPLEAQSEVPLEALIRLIETYPPCW